jgi:hypothetical protein
MVTKAQNQRDFLCMLQCFSLTHIFSLSLYGLPFTQFFNGKMILGMLNIYLLHSPLSLSARISRVRWNRRQIFVSFFSSSDLIPICTCVYDWKHSSIKQQKKELYAEIQYSVVCASLCKKKWERKEEIGTRLSPILYTREVSLTKILCAMLL